jgi:hypothetical protein
VLDEVVKRFRDAGYFEHAGAGLAPDAKQGQALEVEDQGRTWCWVVSKNSTPDDLKLFTQCAQLFLQVHGDTFALQSVKEGPTWETPANPKRPVVAPKKEQ